MVLRPDTGSSLYARSSWQKAGGVGGLAWLQTGIAQTVSMYSYQEVSGNAEVHIPMMDHMGNVRHYYQIKATGNYYYAATVTGQVTASLEYDAFGREVRATGTKTPATGQPPGLVASDPWVDVLPFHFSTKFTDRESGLNYYGYRFYDPLDGRWLNRDPIGEHGGANLYSMTGNAATIAPDLLGLSGECREGKYKYEGNSATLETLLYAEVLPLNVGGLDQITAIGQYIFTTLTNGEFPHLNAGAGASVLENHSYRVKVCISTSCCSCGVRTAKKSCTYAMGSEEGVFPLNKEGAGDAARAIKMAVRELKDAAREECANKAKES